MKLKQRNSFGARLKHRLLMLALATSATLIAVPAFLAGTVNQAVAAGNSGVLTANVTINPSTVLNTVPQTAFGVNTPVWDSDFTDPNLPALLKADGAEMLRYPGGSESDSYNWQTNSIITGCSNCGGYANPNDNFTNFMKIAQAAGAQPIITTNYGTGTPQLAAAWVQDANVTNNYNIKYWEVGNETYGDGVYGSSWEATDRATSGNSGLGPEAYGENALSYIQAMKAVDPNISVGVVLTTPGSWPDGITLSGQTLDWNQTVLSIVGAEAGFVIVHWYSNATSVSAMYASNSGIPTMVSKVRALLDQYDGTTVGSKIPIFVTETNSSIYFDSYQAAVYAPFDELGWIASGASNVDWWDSQNGIGTPTTDPTTGVEDYEDGGILASGNCSGSICEPAADTPFPPYYGLEMIKYFTTTGDQIVQATSDQSNVAAYGSVSPSGGKSVILGNESDSAYQVNLSGITSSSGTSASVYTYNPALNQGITETQASATSVTLPPYSLVVVSSAGSSNSGTTPTTSTTTTMAPTTTSTTTTVAPTTTTTVAPTTTTTSTTVAPTTTTMAPTTTTTTSAPATTSSSSSGTTSATCSVTLKVTSQWEISNGSGGFTANVTVTNNTSSVLNNWSIGWTWPSGQRIVNSWNAEISQSGSSVIAKNATVDVTGSAPIEIGLPISPGSPEVFGLEGTWSGSNNVPTSFTLNGQPCSAVS